MSLGKLTLLSADCDGSGAVVGSSGMVADSSGVDGAGCAEEAAPASLVGAGWRVRCSAARSVTSAAPDKTTALRTISTIDRLFGITHHSKTYGCTGAVRAVTPSQSQFRCRGGLPIGTAYDMASAVLGAQWIGDWR
jgi:hypothetical protein